MPDASAEIAAQVVAMEAGRRSALVPNGAVDGDDLSAAALTAIDTAMQDSGHFVLPARTITAGTGLSGAGSLAANRTITVDYAATAAALTTEAVSTEATGTLTAATIARCDATAENLARTLPAASACKKGQPIVVQKTDSSANTVTVTRAGSDTIGEAGTSRVLRRSGETVIVVSDGTSKWTVIGSDVVYGGAALLNVGTTTGTVAAGDDSRIVGATQKATLTAKGSLYAATAASTPAELAVGTNGKVLAAASGEATGLAWETRIPYVATGDAVLVGGTVTVNDASITANSVIALASKTLGGTPGAVYVSAKTPSTSFALTSTSGTDTSTYTYYVIAY